MSTDPAGPAATTAEPHDDPLRWIVLLHDEEDGWARMSTEQQQVVIDRHDEYAARAADFGVRFVASEALRPAATGRVVRNAEGSVSEGPYAESVEQLSGFYLVDAPDEDSVVAHARLLPDYTIEIRRVMNVP
jgi:hypothetical protein